MEGRGGCCIATYGGEDGGDAMASKVSQIMLRFRPIAPKPVPGPAPVQLCPKAASGSEAGRGASSEAGRGARGRRTGSSGSGERGRKGRKKRALPVEGGEEAVSKQRERDCSNPVTLPLMPVAPERRQVVPEVDASSLPSDLVMSCAPLPWYGCCRQQRQQQMQGLLVPTPLRPAGSMVTVECVTDPSVDDGAGLLWCGEEEARAKLEADNWPAFTSDVYDRVTWTNSAYKKRVAGEEAAQGEGGHGSRGSVRVALMTKGKMPPVGVATAFACRVRVKYASRREKGTLTAQCDVYRLVGGGFSWRLDIDTALGLRL